MFLLQSLVRRPRGAGNLGCGTIATMQPLVTAGLEDPWTSTRAAVKFGWSQLDRKSQRKLGLALAVLVTLPVADFLGVVLFAGVTAVVVGLLTDFSIYQLPDWVRFQDVSPSLVIPLLGGIAVTVLAAKTLISWWMSRKVFLFTARREPLIASRVYATYLTAPFASAEALSRARVSSAVTAGATALMSLLNAAALVIADVVLLVLLAALLLIANPILFLCAAAYFLFLGWFVTRIVGRRSSQYGKDAFEASLAAGETTLASVGFAPEIRLYGIADQFSARLYKDQLKAASTNALQQVIFQVPRYVFDVGIVVGFVGVASISFLVQSPSDAAFTLALFMLSSARMVPALQRLGSNWGHMKLSRARSFALEPILHLPPPEEPAPTAEVDLSSDGADSVAIQFKGVGYTYPGAEGSTLRDIDLTIKRGDRVALVGRTGSGKSTLANLIAGLAMPSAGTVYRGVIDEHASDVAVVPQDVFLAPDSVRNNIALPALGIAEDDERIWDALRMAQVDDVVRALPEGLDTELGERGSRLSGGEAQRLGLARALYRQPRLLVLDEATSSLDAETEKRVSAAISAMPQGCTVVTVAHRLATIRNADLVVLLNAGEVEALGSFDEIVQASPRFAEAAAMQGLAQDSQGDTRGYDDHFREVFQ